MVLNKKTSALLLGLFCLFQTHFAQKLKYWVYLKDKNSNPYSVTKPSEFLTKASVERRITYKIAVDQTDLPVTPSYISSLESISNSRVLYASKWMNGVVMEIESAQLSSVLAQVTAMPFVQTTRRVQRYRVSHPLPFEEPSEKSTVKRTSSATGTTAYNYGGSEGQIKQLGLECLHDKGYRGQGMTIAVCDAGFSYVDSGPIYDSVRANNGILGTRDFADGDENVYAHSTHGSMVFSCLAANAPGSIVGTAPLAKYWLFRTEEPRETVSEEYNWIRAAEFSDSVGVDIITTSLGYTLFEDSTMNYSYQNLNGRTAPMSIASTMAARKGIIVLNAAGNERASAWHYISVPADADSIIAVAAVDADGVDAAFSGVGPSSDGRIKPDLSARGAGTWVSVDQPTGFPGNGTSFACPVLAGAVACYWQAFKSQNNISIIDTLKRNASQANKPDNFKGYGIPNLCAKPIPQRVDLVKISPSEPFDFKAYATNADGVMKIEITNNNYEYIDLEVTDLVGHVHMTQKLDPKTRVVYLDTETLSEGIYIVTLKTSQGTISKKVLN